MSTIIQQKSNYSSTPTMMTKPSHVWVRSSVATNPSSISMLTLVEAAWLYPEDFEVLILEWWSISTYRLNQWLLRSTERHPQIAVGLGQVPNALTLQKRGPVKESARAQDSKMSICAETMSEICLSEQHIPSWLLDAILRTLLWALNLVPDVTKVNSIPLGQLLLTPE